MCLKTSQSSWEPDESYKRSGEGWRKYSKSEMARLAFEKYTVFSPANIRTGTHADNDVTGQSFCVVCYLLQKSLLDLFHRTIQLTDHFERCGHWGSFIAGIVHHLNTWLRSIWMLPFIFRTHPSKSVSGPIWWYLAMRPDTDRSRRINELKSKRSIWWPVRMRQPKLTLYRSTRKMSRTSAPGHSQSVSVERITSTSSFS